MKAYTDLEQSKKLAEILPLESADMRYQAYYDNINNLKYIPRFVSTIIPLKADIPCWSLAALLGVLPILDNRSPVLSKTFDEKYRVIYHSTAYERAILTSDYDNPVDACYELVLKLHELKML